MQKEGGRGKKKKGQQETCRKPLGGAGLLTTGVPSECEVIQAELLRKEVTRFGV
jgi:hypothetical protein